tara:strand:- start:135 stop:374 length:240 start_codon:yes stop_codon:yes gene_type:complete
MSKNYDDSNWREEYLTMKVLSEHATDLLKNGARSLAGSWYLAAMYNDWKKKKGYHKFDPKENEGQHQSSFKEWNKSVDE